LETFIAVIQMLAPMQNYGVVVGRIFLGNQTSLKIVNYLS
jgi:hypothetical protein